MFGGTSERLNEIDVNVLSRVEAVSLLACLGTLRSAIEWLEVRLVGRLDALAAEDAEADGRTVLTNGGHVSRASARRVSKRVAALSCMPRARARFASGEMTSEHLDRLVDAAKATSDEAVESAGLAEMAADLPVDHFGRVCRDWSESQLSAQDAEERHQSHRKNRKVTHRTRASDGSWTLYMEGDAETGAKLGKAIDAEADRLWREAGGRDNPDNTLTREQCRYDALCNLVDGRRSAAPDASGTVVPLRHQFNLVAFFDPGEKSTGDDVRDEGSCRGVGAGAFERRGRIAAEVPGRGRLAPSVVERLLCDADVSVAVSSLDGQPLWLGRTHRTAPPALWRALLVSDGGCIRCGALPSGCEVHHLIPWEAGGLTDPDNCCLLCTRCHHDHHDRGLDIDLGMLAAHRRRRAQLMGAPPGGAWPSATSASGTAPERLVC